MHNAGKHVTEYYILHVKEDADFYNLYKSQMYGSTEGILSFSFERKTNKSC